MDELSEGIGTSGRRNSEAESEEDYPAKRHRSNTVDEDDMDGRCQNNAEAPPEQRSTELLQMDADLHEAILKQELELIKSLIERGASVNSFERKLGETPLTMICKQQRPTSRIRKLNYMEIIRVLLDNGASVNQKNRRGLSPLHLSNSDDVVKVLVEKGASIDELGGSETPLFSACRRYKRSLDVTIELLQAGACVNGANADGAPPLHAASHTVARLLMHSGANVNQVDGTGRTALFVNCEKSNGIATILELLDYGASINLKDKNGLTPLHVACQRGLKLTVELLLQKGASVNEADKHGETPLFFAARKLAATDDIITLLVAHGASVNLHNSCGKTPLHVCRFSATILIQNGALVDALDNDHETPMFIACRRQSQDDGLLTAVLQHGALVNIKNVEGDTALHAACRNLRMDACSLLLRHGADVNELNDKHESPLLLAVKPSCPEELIALLLGAGADINMKNDEGQTPLHKACSKGITHLLKLLLRRGASVNELDNEQASPLMAAFVRSTREDEIINTLLERGASVKVQTTNGVTLLHILCTRARDKSRREQTISLVDRLLQQGAIVNGVDWEDRTPLEIACSYKPCDVALIKSLLKNGATVNRKNALGQTPLHIACGIRQPYSETAATLALLHYGASVNTTDDQGRTPFEVATNESASLLLHYGAPHCPSFCCPDGCPYSNKHPLIANFIVYSPACSAYDLNGQIGRTTVTYYDLLHLHVPRPDFEDILSTVTPQLLESIYPANPRYQNMIYCSYLKIKRLQRMDECCCLFNFISPFLPPEIASIILSYLDLGDLTTLIQIVNALQKR